MENGEVINVNLSIEITKIFFKNDLCAPGPLPLW
jgi:hypothetical protein